MAWVDLHSAAARGDLDQLRRHWWLNKIHINSRNADKLSCVGLNCQLGLNQDNCVCLISRTPLHLACINGHADVVRFLVDENCKLNPGDKYKRSPLMLAVQHQHRDCVAVLLEHGANHDHRAATGNTALHFAVLVSSKSLVELLLEHGADIDVKNELGYTPLTLAITERCKGMIEFLLQKGADVNATDNHKRTPMEVAAILQDKDAVEVLLRNGGVINKEETGAFGVRAFERLFRDELVANEGEEYECSERKGQCSARGTEEINISFSGTTADTVSNTSALLEFCKTLRYHGGKKEKSMWPVGE
ncbi:ankyrin repeat domain-containing protein 7-like [Pseudopipra pipra]|uniref:ankyrin repeat domain-containing protein 7-like n=1 Tax=Pseudopipra pipra TaxID=415032 RepID=UPI00313888B5